jgi:hypothetical protein
VEVLRFFFKFNRKATLPSLLRREKRGAKIAWNASSRSASAVDLRGGMECYSLRGCVCGVASCRQEQKG